MATSQNGWTVHEDQSDLVALGYVTGRVRGGDVHTILTDLCRWFDREIEPIRRADSWGWAYRPIRGKTNGYSNHSSGTAIDVNATTHPLGVRNTFTADQRAKIRAKLRDYEGAVRWGGDYQNRPDDMHFEINADAATLARIAKKLGGASSSVKPSSSAKPSTGGSTSKPSTTNPKPNPNKSEEDELMALSKDTLNQIATAVLTVPVTANGKKAALVQHMAEGFVDDDAQSKKLAELDGKIAALAQQVAKIAKKVGA